MKKIILLVFVVFLASFSVNAAPDDNPGACSQASGTWMGNTNKCCYGNKITALGSKFNEPGPVSGEGCCYEGGYSASDTVGLPNTDKRFICSDGVWYAPLGTPGGPWAFSKEVDECFVTNSYYLNQDNWLSGNGQCQQISGGGGWLCDGQGNRIVQSTNQCNTPGATGSCGLGKACGTRVCDGSTCQWGACNDPYTGYENACDNFDGCDIRTVASGLNSCDLTVDTSCGLEGNCNDGKDNDCDGKVDDITECAECSRSGCAGSCYWKPKPWFCFISGPCTAKCLAKLPDESSCNSPGQCLSGVCNGGYCGCTTDASACDNCRSSSSCPGACYWDGSQNRCCPDGYAWSPTRNLCTKQQPEPGTPCSPKFSSGCTVDKINNEAVCSVDKYGIPGFLEKQSITTY
jgi:hypothetical protein